MSEKILNPGVVLNANTSVEISDDEGKSVCVYRGQIWALPTLESWRTVSKVGQNKGIVQVYWYDGDPDKEIARESAGEYHSSIDQFLLWAATCGARPVLKSFIGLLK